MYLSRMDIKSPFHSQSSAQQVLDTARYRTYLIFVNEKKNTHKSRDVSLKLAKETSISKSSQSIHNRTPQQLGTILSHVGLNEESARNRYEIITF